MHWQWVDARERKEKHYVPVRYSIKPSIKRPHFRYIDQHTIIINVDNERLGFMDATERQEDDDGRKKVLKFLRTDATIRYRT